MAVWFPGGKKKKKGKAKVCLESEEKKSKNPSMTEKQELWKQELQENVSLYFFSLLSLKYI